MRFNLIFYTKLKLKILTHTKDQKTKIGVYKKNILVLPSRSKNNMDLFLNIVVYLILLLNSILNVYLWRFGMALSFILPQDP